MKATNKMDMQDAASTGSDKSLIQFVYRQIKDLMSHYEIVPGQRLIFVDLANRLGISHTPVNNALSILASEGFLDFIPNQGYTVHQITDFLALW